MAPAERCRIFAKLRNKLSVYAGLRSFKPAFVWSREVNPDGSGEHLHVLMHVPARWRSDFEATLFGWFPGPAEAHLQKANQQTRLTYGGKRHSALGYICKQMTTQAWYRRGLTRKAGGPLLGKRSGTTKNLDRCARAAFQASWRPYYGSPPMSAISDAVGLGVTTRDPCAAVSAPMRAGASQ
jgi:hypothetical protein